MPKSRMAAQASTLYSTNIRHMLTDLTPAKDGVLVQNNVTLGGETTYIGAPKYKAHGRSTIKLQDHGDPSEPISFRNIWVRPLASLQSSARGK